MKATQKLLLGFFVLLSCLMQMDKAIEVGRLNDNEWFPLGFLLLALTIYFWFAYDFGSESKLMKRVGDFIRQKVLRQRGTV